MSLTAPNLLQAIRAHYGISFRLLAGFLGVSEPLLWLAATNRRELPTTAYLRLRPLAEALPPPWNPAAAGISPPASPPVALRPTLAAPLTYPPEPVALRQRLHACRHLAQRAARALACLQRRQDQGRHLLAVLPALAALPALDERAVNSLSLFEAVAREYTAPAASAALALLQARQQGLQAEAAQLAEWLGEAQANNSST